MNQGAAKIRGREPAVVATRNSRLRTPRFALAAGAGTTFEWRGSIGRGGKQHRPVRHSRRLDIVASNAAGGFRVGCSNPFEDGVPLEVVLLHETVKGRSVHTCDLSCPRHVCAGALDQMTQVLHFEI